MGITTAPTPSTRSTSDPAEPNESATPTTSGTQTDDPSDEVPVDEASAAGAADDAVAGTGDEHVTDTTIAVPTEAAAVEFVASEDVPDIEMLDLSTGSTVSLRSVVIGDTPLLFWFWSPL